MIFARDEMISTRHGIIFSSDGMISVRDGIISCRV
jgi:hypothetical protein